MKKQARGYQRIAIERGVKQNLGIFDQMGVGKTLEAIEITKEVFNQYNAPALVICPKSIRSQWHDMIVDQDSNAEIWVFNDDIDDLMMQLVLVDYVIIHYESIVKYINTFSKQTWSTIIVDEAHRIKTRTTLKRHIETKREGKRLHHTAAIKKLRAYRKLALTGTPWETDPRELWSILNFLEPRIFSSYWKYVETHFEFDTDYWGYKKNYRLKNPSNFSNAIRPHVIRRTKRMVMPELPPMIISHIPIELNPKQREIYDRIKAVKDLEVDQLTIPNALAKLVRLHQVASNPILLGYECSSAKIDWLKEWLVDNPAESFIIFTRYRDTAAALAHQVDASYMIGGMKSTSHLRGSYRIVGTIAALALGHDLGHINTAIFIDSDYDSILMDQAAERIDRGSNTIPKNVIYLQATNTVDDLIKTALNSKWNTKQLVEKFLQEVENDLRVTL